MFLVENHWLQLLFQLQFMHILWSEINLGLDLDYHFELWTYS